MSRPIRLFYVIMGTLLALVLGLVAPLAMKGEAWRNVHWVNPYALLALLLVPFVVFRMTLGADKRIPRVLVGTIAPLLLGPRGFRTRLRDLPGILRGAALVIAVLAIARPQNVDRGEQSEDKGIDIVLVLDLSGSMHAIMDGPRPPSSMSLEPGHRPTRIDTAKEVLVDFIKRRKTDRIGIVVFGTNAYILSPPTLDYALLSSLVEKIQLGDVNGGGTAIGDAVGTAVARMRRSTARSKAIILLTDGDSNAGTVAPEYAAHLAAEQGVHVYTVQIGNGDDAEVEKGKNLFGQPIYAREHYPVNPELLKKMSAKTGGESYVANDGAGLAHSMHEILDRLEKTKFSADSATMEDLFPSLLIPAILLLALEALTRLLVVKRFP